MRFIINGIVFETDKMQLISERVERWIKNDTLAAIMGREMGHYKPSKLWKSNKGNWLITTESDYNSTYGKQLGEVEVKELLIRYDYNAYVKEFGELEEA